MSVFVTIDHFPKPVRWKCGIDKVKNPKTQITPLDFAEKGVSVRAGRKGRFPAW